ncbi:MAG: hypothetical protein J6R88_01930 [Clostridia bacterium]|nr:hypothetical protein [Clostridia bacterium]
MKGIHKKILSAIIVCILGTICFLIGATSNIKVEINESNQDELVLITDSFSISTELDENYDYNSILKGKIKNYSSKPVYNFEITVLTEYQFLFFDMSEEIVHTIDVIQPGEEITINNIFITEGDCECVKDVYGKINGGEKFELLYESDKLVGVDIVSFLWFILIALIVLMIVFIVKSVEIYKKEQKENEKELKKQKILEEKKIDDFNKKYIKCIYCGSTVKKPIKIIKCECCGAPYQESQINDK